MKRAILIGFIFLMAWTAAAQDRDSLLARMNGIKMDSGQYLYGLCTISDEPNPDVSREAARGELLEQIAAYLPSANIRFLRPATIPEDAISYLVCQLRPSCFRTLAYVQKSRLMELEADLVRKTDDQNRKEGINHFLSSLSKAATLDEIEHLLSDCDLAGIRFGWLIDDETQRFLDQSYLVYYERNTGRILEIMTPPAPGEGRKNLCTSSPADPLIYKTTPFWIYLEER